MLRCCRYLLLVLLLAQLLLPGQRSLAQAESTVFFRATGHQLSDEYGFLSFWEAHGGERILGLPITEPFQEEQRIVQYLERARLEYHPTLDAILLGRLGAERTRWRTFPAAPPTLPSSDTLRFPETGHTLAPPFRRFWEAHGGLAVFGLPLSEPLWEVTDSGFSRVQYFERVRLEYHQLSIDADQQVQVSPLGLEVALALGLDLEPVAARPGAVSIGTERRSVLRAAAYALDAPAVPSPTAAAPAPAATPASLASAAPTPTAVPTRQAAQAEQFTQHQPRQLPRTTGPGRKWIAIDLTKQWLYAYEGDHLVYDAPVATGKDGFNTPAGEFAVYAKVPMQTMSGTLNGETWEVPNVPHILYFNGDVGLHGTYWHNLFGTGTRISHGCVNLRVTDAAWIYDWASVGTPVLVHY